MSTFEQDVDIPVGGTQLVLFDAPFLEPPTVTVRMHSGGDCVIPYVFDIQTNGCIVGMSELSRDGEGRLASWRRSRKVKKRGLCTATVTAIATSSAKPNTGA